MSRDRRPASATVTPLRVPPQASIARLRAGPRSSPPRPRRDAGPGDVLERRRPALAAPPAPRRAPAGRSRGGGLGLRRRRSRRSARLRGFAASLPRPLRRGSGLRARAGGVAARAAGAGPRLGEVAEHAPARRRRGLGLAVGIVAHRRVFHRDCRIARVAIDVTRGRVSVFKADRALQARVRSTGKPPQTANDPLTSECIATTIRTHV